MAHLSHFGTFCQVVAGMVHLTTFVSNGPLPKNIIKIHLTSVSESFIFTHFCHGRLPTSCHPAATLAYYDPCPLRPIPHYSKPIEKPMLFDAICQILSDFVSFCQIVSDFGTFGTFGQVVARIGPSDHIRVDKIIKTDPSASLYDAALP